LSELISFVSVNRTIILGGDFNFVVDIALDKIGGTNVHVEQRFM
jgi:hypothetical protein